ncbi:MAG TPA: hypothetical protein VGF51_10240 [Acidimicrobiales bacterium]
MTEVYSPKSGVWRSGTSSAELRRRRPASDFFALVFEVRRHGVVACARQQSAQVDQLLSVDVLAIWTPENLGLLADSEQKHVVVPLFDRSDCLEQGDDIVPLDVVVRLLLKDLQQGVSMMAAEMLGPWD